MHGFQVPFTSFDVWQLFRLQSCLGFADALRQLGPGCLTACRCSIGPEIRVPKIFLPRLISHRPKCKRCKSWQGSPEKFPFMGETLRGAERPQCRFDCPYAASLGRHSRVGVWKIRVSWFGVEGFGASVEGYGQNLPRKPGTLKEHPLDSKPLQPKASRSCRWRNRPFGVRGSVASFRPRRTGMQILARSEDLQKSRKPLNFFPSVRLVVQMFWTAVSWQSKFWRDCSP